MLNCPFVSELIHHIFYQDIRRSILLLGRLGRQILTLNRVVTVNCVWSLQWTMVEKLWKVGKRCGFLLVQIGHCRGSHVSRHIGWRLELVKSLLWILDSHSSQDLDLHTSARSVIPKYTKLPEFTREPRKKKGSFRKVGKIISGSFWSHALTVYTHDLLGAPILRRLNSTHPSTMSPDNACSIFSIKENAPESVDWPILRVRSSWQAHNQRQLPAIHGVLHRS